MIRLVTGTPGSGKSLYSMMELVRAVSKGRYVATNIELVPGWEYTAARLNSLSWVIPARREALASRYRGLVYSSGDVSELMALRLPGKGEGRGLLIFDEAQLWLNSRLWREGDRDRIIRWFTQHRKIGWDVLLITQRAKSIDAQVSELAEYETKLRNLKGFKVLGLPVTGGLNLFLAVWAWAGVRDNRAVRRQTFRLNRRMRGIYSTVQVYEGDGLGAGEDVSVPFATAVARARHAAPVRADAPQRSEDARPRRRPLGASGVHRYDPADGSRLHPPIPSPRGPRVPLHRRLTPW